MKVNIGIVGYGNLGKAVEQSVLSNTNFNLVAIFSRRNVTSKFNTKIEHYENFTEYVGKIDVMVLCGGSMCDLEIQTPEISRYFDTINTFDTHKKLPSEFEKLNKIAKKYGHRVIMACGWDPGIFSIIRCLFKAISKKEPITFWGKGVSMGHSDAIRRIDGVLDGVQFTIPNIDAVRLARLNKLDADVPKHFRECFVVAEPKNHIKIEHEIKNIPNYFKGQPTNVTFVSGEKLLRLKSKLCHKGQVISSFNSVHGTKNKMEFLVSMESNPNFTASIVTAYINAIINLKEMKLVGAFTNLDIPVSFLFLGKEKDNLIKNLC